MNDFPIPLQILDRSSRVKKLLEKNNLKEGSFEKIKQLGNDKQLL